MQPTTSARRGAAGSPTTVARSRRRPTDRPNTTWETATDGAHTGATVACVVDVRHRAAHPRHALPREPGRDGRLDRPRHRRPAAARAQATVVQGPGAGRPA